MKNTALKSLLKSVAFCLSASAVLVACGGSTPSAENQSQTKLLASLPSCAPVWSASTAYVGGNTALYNTTVYKANWWTQGNNPSTSSGPAGSGQPWTALYPCDDFRTTSTTTSSTSSTSSTSTTTSSTTSTTLGGSDCPAYKAGTAYAYGQKVSNVGKGFTCDVAGWCSLGASAYEPGVGWASTSAWSPATCLNTSTTTTSSTTSSTMCAYGSWWDAIEMRCRTSTTITTSTSTSSTSTSSTTSSTFVQGGNHQLIGYWHNFTNPSGPTYRIRDVTNEWDVIMISFGEDGGNGAVTFNLDPNAGTEAQFIADIAAKRAAGKKVVLSLGGQEGRMTLSTAENVTNFVNSLHGLIVKYGFDGIDLDLESGAGVVLGSPIINNLVTAVKQLKAKVGPSFYLSMAPEHPYVQGGYVAFSGIWGAYLPIIDGLRNELNVIHVQYYNNGGLYTPYSAGALNEGTVDALVGGSRMLIEGFKTVGGTGWEFKGLRPDQVAFGVPSGPRSANQGFVTAATVKNTLTCMAQLVGCGAIKPLTAYPSYNGVMTWSINWDKYDGYNFSLPAKAALNSLPKLPI